MTTARRNHLTNDHVRSPFISERRRKLFPTDDGYDKDSELGNIAPIGDSSESDNETSSHPIYRSETPLGYRTYSESESMSPLNLSPGLGFRGYTPRKYSPSQNYKTPHDTSTKPVLEREQKTLLEESKSLKRKLTSPHSSPGNSKVFKSDGKSSKVRTALFPPETALDMSLPPTSFYSKNQENIMGKLSLNKDKYVYKQLKFNPVRHTHRTGRKIGQINNGVRHKIRKPKQKKISKTVIAKATKKMLETGEALNEYIQDLRELKNKQNTEQKLIEQPVVKKPVNDPVMQGYLKDLKQLESTHKKLIVNPPKQIQLAVAEQNKENVEYRQRSVSPLSGPASPNDKSRKFFKSSRSKQPIKELEKIAQGLEEKEVSKFTLPSVEFQESNQRKILLNGDNDFDEDDIDISTNIDNILSALPSDSPMKSMCSTTEDSWIPLNHDDNSTPNLPAQNACDKQNLEYTNKVSPLPREVSINKITLEAHTSVRASDNAVQLHEHNVASMLLSPISQMCDVTSGLALNSPIRGRNLTSTLFNKGTRASRMLSFNGSNCNSVDMEQQKKLFPIFCKGASTSQSGGNTERGEKRERNDVLKKGVKRFKNALAPDQMLLDAGQKKFGFTICNECSLVYHLGDPNDERQHMNYHQSLHILRFSGWKNEHLVADFQDEGRIIKILPTDSKIWIKKVIDLLQVVKRDMGCFEMETDVRESQVYFYIKCKTIAGCAAASVPKEKAYRMLPPVGDVFVCSEESYPVKCGISYLWVASRFRKQGIASALIDAVKLNFIPGEILSNDDVALTSPTVEGTAFAEKYFKTSSFLIYA